MLLRRYDLLIDVLVSLLVACVLAFQQIGIEQTVKNIAHKVTHQSENKEHQHDAHSLEDRWKRRRLKKEN
jgi:hypothetical protein